MYINTVFIFVYVIFVFCACVIFGINVFAKFTHFHIPFINQPIISFSQREISKTQPFLCFVVWIKLGKKHNIIVQSLHIRTYSFLFLRTDTLIQNRNSIMQIYLCYLHSKNIWNYLKTTIKHKQQLNFPFYHSPYFNP